MKAVNRELTVEESYFLKEQANQKISRGQNPVACWQPIHSTWSYLYVYMHTYIYVYVCIHT